MILFSSKSKIDQTAKSRQRNQIRSLLRKSSRGNAYSFLQVSHHYFDLLSEYFYLIGYTDSRDRIFEITSLLTECWSYLPYTRRVSDFERFLQLRLEKRAASAKFEIGEKHPALSSLNHEERFLLVAREFEEWSYKTICLAIRSKKSVLSSDLMSLKCKLVQFKPKMLKADQQNQLLQISELLESELNAKQTRKVEQDAAQNYHILQFKADWLAYRCELIELRQRMRLGADDIELLKEKINDAIKGLAMERPKISDSVINQISFVRLPSKVYRS